MIKRTPVAGEVVEAMRRCLDGTCVRVRGGPLYVERCPHHGIILSVSSAKALVRLVDDLQNVRTEG